MAEGQTQTLLTPPLWLISLDTSYLSTRSNSAMQHMERKERWSFKKFFFILFFCPEIVPKAVAECNLARARAVVANTAE